MPHDLDHHTTPVQHSPPDNERVSSTVDTYQFRLRYRNGKLRWTIASTAQYAEIADNQFKLDGGNPCRVVIFLNEPVTVAIAGQEPLQFAATEAKSFSMSAGQSARFVSDNPPKEPPGWVFR